MVRACSPRKSSRTLFDIINEQFDIRKKVGGIERVLEETFGNVLLIRLYPQSFVGKTEINNSRGILLYEPLGTGKSFIAQTICDVLNAAAKVICGPEIFSCMLGELEKKIRDLFDDARRDQKPYGANSQLHVIIFDEIDTVYKNRTHNGLVRDIVHNNVTAQLFAEIDAMVCLDNILIIGTTNFLEEIDLALLRPRRIETVIENKLPDAIACSYIFYIYTKALIRNGAMNQDVNINNIIGSTEGMTGSHVERVVRLAIHAAMQQDIIERDRFDVTEEEGEALEVCNRDFLVALSKIRI